jgi:hypothetical protein
MPLNFIMLKEDFRELFQTFHHGHTFARYLSHIYMDSLFTVLELTRTTKEQAASNLKHSFQQQIKKSEKLLQNYAHLLETEDIDC